MVLADLEGRLAALRTQLCPPRIYLQIQDQAITGMALEGRQVRWLEKLPLSEGVCRHGAPLLPVALGDLIGDWLMERGYGGAQVKAVLPPSACSWRVLDPPLGLGPPEQRNWACAMAQGLALVGGEGGHLEGFDLLVEPLASTQLPRLLLVAVAQSLLVRWLEVADQAGCELEALQPTCVCHWNGWAALRGMLASDPREQLLLQPDCAESWLLALDDQQPVGEWLLPPVSLDPSRVLPAGFVGRALACGGALVHDPGAPWPLGLVSTGQSPQQLLQWASALQGVWGGPVRWLDPVQMGGLLAGPQLWPGSGMGSLPWLLWGLAAPHLAPV